MPNIRNIAIIAHVDHGKTTLVDALLRQSKTKLDKEIANETCIMDSNPLEKERGITIFSKNAAVCWGETKINIIDTPGHADFGGEVERVLTMADGVLLLIDAAEGPMPQTRFVLKKALAMKLPVIVVINKVDKPGADPHSALDKTMELFLELAPDQSLEVRPLKIETKHILDFPVVYASGKQGLAGLEPDISKMRDISPLFEAILKYIPAPRGDEILPLQMLVTTLSRDDFKGRIATAKIFNGLVKAGQEVMHINRQGEQKKERLISLMVFNGLERVEVEEARAGDIVAIAGVPYITAGETVADVLEPKALPLIPIEEPTVKMTITINDSPFAGKEGQYTTSRQIEERLMKELETDMALKVERNAERLSGWTIAGRGELHLAILIERMRREGYEFQVSRPQVIVKEVEGKVLVPFEKVFIEVPEIYSGVVIQKLGSRHGELLHMHTRNFSSGLDPAKQGLTLLEFSLPTRGLFGYRNEFLTDTRGLGIMNTLFDGYKEDIAEWPERSQGSLVAHETGETALYGMVQVQDRGVFFVGPGVTVYKGQVVGQNSRQGDIRVNVCKTKHLSNMRSKGEGGMEHFNAPREMGLEDALEYIGDDELVEVTPKNIRIRKMVLDEVEERRKRSQGAK
jgi:GTP-binding protein